MPTKPARSPKARTLTVKKDTLRTLSPTKQAKAVKGGAYLSAGCMTSLGGKTAATQMGC